MGAAGLLLGGTMLGLGASALGSKQSTASALAVPMATPARPEPPVAPTVTTDGETGVTQNALMEEERTREKQAALLRRQQAAEIFTSGLGASGLAQTAKKSLLGE